MEDDYIIVGIGCNVNSKPAIASTGANGGRAATCIRECVASFSTNTSGEMGEEVEMGEVSPEMEEIRVNLACDIFAYCSQWLNFSVDSCTSAQDTLISEANAYISKETQYIRLDNTTASTSVLGRKVIPLRVNKDGTLQVCSSMYLYVIRVSYI